MKYHQLSNSNVYSNSSTNFKSTRMKPGLTKGKLAMWVALFVLGVLSFSLIIVLSSKEAQVVCPSAPISMDEVTTSSTLSPEGSSSVSPPTRPPSIVPWSFPRLPRHVTPVHYDITLHPRLHEGTFDGKTEILVKISQRSNHLWLHNRDLKVKTVTVQSKDKSFVAIKNHFYFPDNEVYVIIFEEPIESGNYTVKLEFSGSLVDKIIGFYRSAYEDSTSGETRYLATSKFEPTYARQAYPCFDEPNFKTTFTIHLIHDKDMTALSNMDLEEKTPFNGDVSGLVVSSFRKSVPMTTYLTVFVVCDFKSIEGKTNDGKPFRVWARQDQIQNAKFALDIGANLQSRYIEYFNISWPLPKLELIAIPDFPSGAMENWGLITFRETALLYDPAVSSAFTHEYNAEVVAHEITHGWFGNLVTMKWWDDLWLNEGFASFFSYMGMNWVLPDWKVDFAIVTDTFHVALRQDDKTSSHPIVQPATNPDQITASFDSISYSKGSAIIHMLQGFVGENVFQKGVQKYLKNHMFANAKTEDLWRAITSETKGLDIPSIMNTWTNQMGYPVIHIHRHAHEKMSHMRANQSRFLIDPNATYDSNESPYKYRWNVPLTYKTSASGEVKTIWINNTEQSKKFVVDNLSPEGWIKFNVDNRGYYRVNYEEEGWKQLSDALVKNHLAFSAADRANLIDDSFNIAKSGQLSYDIPLKMIAYLDKERLYEPWTTAFNSLGDLQDRLYYTTLFPNYRNLILKIVENVYSEFAWKDGGDHNSKKVRIVVMNLACSIDHPGCLRVASDKLKSWIHNATDIPAEELALVLNSGMKQSGGEEWEELYKMYLKENSPQLKKNLLGALTFVRIPWLLSRLLDVSLNNTIIKKQDFTMLLARIGRNPVGKPLLWTYLREKWPKIVSVFTLNDRGIGKLVSKFTSTFSTPLELKELKEFFATYPEGGAGELGRKQALDSIQERIRWWERSRQSLQNYFNSV